MTRIRRLWHRTLGALTGRRHDADLAEEIESHLRLHTDDNLRRGMPPDEARRAAVLRLGGVEATKERYRDQRGLPALDTLVRDVRVAIRALRKAPGFTLACVLTIALAIGGIGAIFSAVNAVLLRPLPYPEADRLVQVWETNPRINRWGDWASGPDVVDWQRDNEVFEGLAGFRAWRMRLTGGESPEMAPGLRASASLFTVLRVTPMLGRPFLPDEDVAGRSDVAILGYDLWQRQFGSDPSVVGRPIAIDGRPHTVVGIMPPGFAFPIDLRGTPQAPQIWLPLVNDEDRGSHNYRVVARLKADRTLAHAQRDMDRIAQEIARLHRSHEGRGIEVAGLQQRTAKNVRPALLILLGAIGLVLLIACANVANLLLARGATRQKEAALRQALGAGRARLLQQWITESVVLALLGGAAGLLVAFLGVRALVDLGPPLPLLRDASIDHRVLAFTLVTVLATGLAFGLAPAFQALRVDVQDALKESGLRHAGSHGRSRLRRLLTVGELALALMLLVGAGLLMRSFVQLRGVDAGFDADRLVLGFLAAPPETQGTPAERADRTLAFFRDILTRLEALPGVQVAAAASAVPIVSHESGPFRVERAADADPAGTTISAERPRVTPGYFQAMGIPLRRGREFAWTDARGAPLVTIVSEGLAARYWPGRDPLGQRVSIVDGAWLTVVGVAKDVRNDALDLPARPAIYVPLMQYDRASVSLLVRTEADAATIVEPMRRAVLAANRQQPLFGVQPMTRVLGDSIALQRFLLILLGAFAGVAALLGVVGVYGVLSYFVNQRRQEIGIRLALGASRRDVVWLVLREAAALTSVGIALGLIGASALSHVLTQLLYGVTATDPATFAIVPALLALVVLAASCLPARAAARVAPMVALRGE